MEEFRKLLKEKRPNLSDGSIKTYTSILSNLHNKVFGSKTINLDNFKETNRVLDYLKEIPSSNRKTVLAALFVISDEKPYRDLMMNDIKIYNKDISKQEMSDYQKENSTTKDDIISLWEEYKKNAETLYKKTALTAQDYQEIQSYIILSLLGGIFIPPRRALDYCMFKIKTSNDAEFNYIDGMYLVFNVYKTSKTYGEQRIKIPTPLKKILTKWIKYNPTDFLLFDNQFKMLNAVKLNQRLNKIFDGKKISINALRHAYMTDKYGDTIKSKQDMYDDFKGMGSSANMECVYIQKK
jgi:hypothetical protein